ncbi:hypothetical protein [Paracandidimonas soli]|uniref:Uncharacterized protein n=1 Tax=Paracandidimonas soli TaxID=1917182 RepID=A0A4R3V8S5_9BURK|nr:hypothetical protein [Paracandidimonas soli]TCV01546.1 hypothetical protein EV686_102258 [Paracandidimonas soli]
MKIRKPIMFSAALLAVGFSGAAAAWNQLDLNQNGNVANAPYLGSFNYNGQTYGPSTALSVPDQSSTTIASTFDLNSLQAFKLYGKDGANGHGHNDILLSVNDNSAAANAPVVYRLYRQNYSAAVVNLSRGTEARHFVKSVVGEQTTPGTLVNGTYSYTGVAFTNFPRGDFNYGVTVLGPSSAVGQGTFSLNEIKIPGSQSSTGDDIFFDINSGKLNATNLIATSNGLVFNGGVTVTDADVSNADAWAEIGGPSSSATYNLTLFGPNGAEIAGSIQGLPDRIGSAAIIGVKQ